MTTDPSGPPVLDRRSALRGLAALTAVLTVVGCGSADRAPVLLAAGEPGGFFWEFSGLLAAAAARAGTARVEPLRSGGSAENLDLLRSGRADLAISLSDTAQDSAGAQDLRAVGRVYENYFQVAVRHDTDITSLPGLAGRTVSIGAAGSGATTLSERVLATAGLSGPDAVRRVQQPMRAAAAALADGSVDAVMWAGGVPTPAFSDAGDIRLLDLTAAVAALRQRYGTSYEPVSVPADAYGRHPAVTTVGVANLLLARADVDDQIAAALVDLLLDDPSALVPDQAIGSQFLDAQSLIQTGPVVLHPGAAAEYRRRHG
ncbi:TAXI family TRAP transporter solute-binding subunit [Mycolicibacterium bacteremicum]|uniref:TAXI family TRAP transporter solute-binding subunit n=1 Tax=Mycolicibacterium bacteremicum TaxID=564198 RepID=UPI0026F0F866|nr:TAXI family TRAP transporter solute-binding subunit [Mycolicibacterium bacteremicum]